MPDETLTYQSSGVDIDAAHRSLRAVLPDIRASYNENVVAGVGGFGGLFHASFPGIQQPVLVSSIDGVGTKTRVAAMMGDFSGLGFDIVNHCVNDILCQGARPLFFMDYFGTSMIQSEQFQQVVGSIAKACTELQMPLLGGETAELPGVYHDEEIDIIGSIVGVVDFDRRFPRGLAQSGDALVGIASTGLHTNGFSLARKALFEIAGYSVRDEIPTLNSTIGAELLRPHKCYFQSVYPLLQEEFGVKAVAHITGGGLYDNLPRALPTDMQGIVDRRTWTPLPIFQLIQEAGNVPDQEMFRTFNMGIGMVLLVDADAAAAVVQQLNQSGEAAAVIGQIQSGPHDVQIV
ncbi:MAG: phosphoribosylformylglycinamidine cyclo-ligase [Armatimonadetes bacterium]|nr:phosphoribosylformylglycinamidine cyclo-ligase [Armatimonadota bacterium]